MRHAYDERITPTSSWRRCLVVWLVLSVVVVTLSAAWAGSVEPDSRVPAIVQTWVD